MVSFPWRVCGTPEGTRRVGFHWTVRTDSPTSPVSSISTQKVEERTPREERRQCLSGQRSQGRSAMSRGKTSLETSGPRDKAWEHQTPRPRPLPMAITRRRGWWLVVATIRTRGRTARAKSRWSNEETRLEGGGAWRWRVEQSK